MVTRVKRSSGTRFLDRAFREACRHSGTRKRCLISMTAATGPVVTDLSVTRSASHSAASPGTGSKL